MDVIGFDRANDIAVVRMRGAAGLPTANIRTSSNLAVGEPIAAIGNSNGTGSAPSYAPGSITQLGASVRASDESAAVPANSMTSSASRPTSVRATRAARW